MSILTLGIDDVSEETRTFKDKLSSKGISRFSVTWFTYRASIESQLSAQQMKLMKQAAELDELQSTLNDALHKVRTSDTCFCVEFNCPLAITRNQPCAPARIRSDPSLGRTTERKVNVTECGTSTRCRTRED